VSKIVSKCDFCQYVEEGQVFYHDDKVAAMLAKKPASAGHIVLFPINHYDSFEALPEDITEHLFDIANKLSVLVFERLKVAGTNIISKNNGQHLSIHIIPRNEDDGIDFQWEPKKLSDDDMNTALLFYEDLLKKDKSKKEEPKHEKKEVKTEEKIPDKKEEKKEEKVSSEDLEKIEEEEGEENYLIKQLDRLP
jgi:histidine triad (HIT) family protein